ncbi:hypothetical protein WA026_004102 [Henosepilachna vigintioctopunctata]|uniref:Uncharacterized protein n=1 Tax=Henosepilachna vigintioctopunctata TaxID=420089 RepID=A0AAW1U6B3_9CUCU
MYDCPHCQQSGKNHVPAATPDSAGMSSRFPLVKDYYPPVSPFRPNASPGVSHGELWIGEETKKAMPPHVYKYYLARTKCYRRQSLRKELLEEMNHPPIIHIKVFPHIDWFPSHHPSNREFIDRSAQPYPVTKRVPGFNLKTSVG